MSREKVTQILLIGNFSKLLNWTKFTDVLINALDSSALFEYATNEPKIIAEDSEVALTPQSTQPANDRAQKRKREMKTRAPNESSKKATKAPKTNVDSHQKSGIQFS